MDVRFSTKMFTLVVVFVILRLSNGVPLEPDRIHGGIEAPPGFAPHMAAILSSHPWERVVCGGSIVTKKHILTAAHCITPFVDHHQQLASTLCGRVGSNIWLSGGTIVHYKSYYVHPEWDADNIKNDVGVFSLNEPLELNEKIAIIRLEFGMVGGNEPSYVTGWGTTWPKIDEISVQLAPTPDELQLLFVKTLSHEDCKASVHSNPQWLQLAPPLDPNLEICTFYSVGYGMCHGDSGSALVSVISKQQIGIVSWGFPCALGAPDMFTRIGGVKDFLLPILRTCPSFTL